MKIRLISMLRLKSSFWSCFRIVFILRDVARRRRVDFLRMYFMVVSFVNKQGKKTRCYRGPVHTRGTRPEGLGVDWFPRRVACPSVVHGDGHIFPKNADRMLLTRSMDYSA